MSSKEVVIIGGSFAGIAALKALVKSKDVKLSITVVSPSDKALFNIGTPRATIETEKIDKIFYDVNKAIKTHVSGTIHSGKFIKAYVTEVDLGQQVVYLSNNETLHYENLIIASGTTTQHPAFKLDNERDSRYTIDAIKGLNKQIKDARKIAIIGGGPTGVELAGEIGYEYGSSKSVTLFTGSTQPLPVLSKGLGDKATQKLQNLHVKVVNNKKSKSYTETTVTFNDGSSESFDLVIPAFQLIPNSQFLSNYPKITDANGFIITDDYLRLKDYPNVIAFGDIVSQGVKSLVDILFGQVGVLRNTIAYEVFGKKSVTLKAYKQPGTTLIVPIGKGGGVGTAFGLNFPNFAVSFLKSKDYMIPKGGENLS
ncbi:uncharacterized protein RJT21DRAFT_88248 [Scheffersomyces amazonensis]|uniref:uncharacterized protein n=1 Tax=Scheffersomyces amazonensis TaxID=1078765 RepID=UPI00315D136E